MNHLRLYFTVFWGLIFLVDFSLSYDKIVRLGDSPYEVRPLFQIPMNVAPHTVQILKPSSPSSQIIATFDLVYTTSVGEIRLISELPTLMTAPNLIPERTNVVTAHKVLPNPTKVGILPKNTLDRQDPVVWWITAGVFSKQGVAGGAIFLMRMVTNNHDAGHFYWTPVAIYKSLEASFTQVAWIDMDIDGRKDCLTIRETLGAAQLIWLRQPMKNSGGSQFWAAYPISNSTDDVGGTEFGVIRWKAKGGRRYTIIAVAGKRTQTLSVIWNDDPDNDWTQTHRIRSREIAKYDQFVDIQVTDLNGDGRPDIMVTVAAVSAKPGKLLAFEFPLNGNFAEGRWRKHVLAEWNSKTKYYLISPRASMTFYPITGKSKKPHILVSGGSDKKVYVVSPNSWNYVSWDYTVYEIFEDKYAVGTPAVGDVDGDGGAEIFIPTGQKIHVLKFGES